MQRSVAFKLLQLCVDKAYQRGVLGACRNAGPVVRADALDDGVFARGVLEGQRESRKGVEHAVDLALGQRDISGRVVIESFDFLETSTALGFQSRIQLGLQRLPGRA